MATNYTGNSTPTLNNAPASSWTDDAAKHSHVGNTYLVTGSGGTAGNVYAFEEYPTPLIKNASGLPADIVTITDGGENQNVLKATVTLSPIQSGTPSIESGVSKTPYLFRATGATAECNYETNKVVGGTVAWNQLVQNGNFESTSGWASTRGTQAVSNNELTYTVTERGGGALQNRTARSISFPKGHKVFVALEYFAAKAFKVIVGLGGATSREFTLSNGVTTSAWNRLSAICQNDADDVTELRIGSPSTSGSMAVGDAYKFRNVILIDLTQMFGSAIADYIYALETANAGAGVAWFRKLFPKPYYAYNAGELMSVQTSAHKMVGFNAWDEQWEAGGISALTGENIASSGNSRTKNYIPVIPSTAYYFKSPVTLGLRFYDANMMIIGDHALSANSLYTMPSGCHYLRFVMVGVLQYANNICINLSWDGERDGEYEEYKQWVYPLDSDLTLRGIPKLSSGNDLYYDGDEYESDGTVTRKYGIVDLGTLNWSRNTASTNPRFIAQYDSLKSNGDSVRFNGICANYNTVAWFTITGTTVIDKVVGITAGGGHVYIGIIDSAYTDAATFKTAMSGVYLVYELATPTTESADPFTSPQTADKWGTEEYVDIRTVPIPVGHETQYGMQYAVSGHTGATLNRTGGNLFVPPNTVERGSLDESGLNINHGQRLRTSGYIPVTEGETIRVFIWSDIITRFAVSGYTADDFSTPRTQSTAWTANGSTVTIASGVKYIRLNFNTASGTPQVYAEDISRLLVVDNSTATASLSLGQTVYGGKIDLVTGEGEITWAKMTPDIYSLQSVNNYGIANYTFSFTTGGGQAADDFWQAKASAMSNALPVQTSGISSTSTEGFMIANSSTGYIRLLNSVASSVAAANQWIADNGFYIVYRIATPIPLSLSGQQIQTLLGENIVWGDGEVSQLVYRSNQFTPAWQWFETWTMPKITRDNGQVIVLPYPQEYTPEIYDVDAATTGRNAAGTMIRDRVARKHKFNYKFPPLSQADATEILDAVQDVSFTLTTASPETGAKANYRVYVGDRSLPVYWMPNHNNASWLYSSLSLNLIEM